MKTLACLLTALLVPLLLSAKEKTEKPAVPDATIADLTFGQVVNEATLDKEQLKGKVVVVEEWGVNCPPCIASLPDLARLARSNEKKGLVVIGMEMQNSKKEDILKVLKSARVTYPVTAGGSTPAKSKSIPHACVFDSTGKLVWHGNPHNEDFEREVKKALRGIKK
jgi:thiol-disulfide isomerase/thioredoxin